MPLLKVYIRAFQQASDLDDTVEEKLLIGDRPKKTASVEEGLSLRDRLLQRHPDDRANVCFCLYPTFNVLIGIL